MVPVDPRTSPLKPVLSHPLSVISFSQTSDGACVTTKEKGYYVFELMAQSKPALVHSFPEVKSQLVYMMSDRQVMVCNGKYSCSQYDIENRGEVKQIQFKQTEQENDVKNEIEKLSIGKQCKYVAVMMKDKTVSVLEAESFSEVEKTKTNGVFECCNGVLAYGDPKKTGILCIRDLNSEESISITAHQSTVSCISLNKDGKLVATASERGTLIRIFDTKTGKKVHEVRRGTKHVQMHSIAFSEDSCYLCCYSSSGTVHLFNLVNAKENTYSSMYVLSYMGISFLSSQWSMQECVIGGGSGIVKFAKDQGGTIFLLTYSGKLGKIQFDLEKKMPPKVVQIFDINECLQTAAKQRREENLQVISKHPNTVPLFLAIRKGSLLPLLSKRKFLVPNTMTVGEFCDTLNTKLNLDHGSIRLWVREEMLDQSLSLKTVHHKYEEDDSFLYCSYDLDPTWQTHQHQQQQPPATD